jgi:adenylate cyclase
LLLFFTALAASGQDQESWADTLYVKGMGFFQLGDVDSASSYFEKVVAIRAAGDSSKLINTFCNLGRCYADMGRNEIAWIAYQNSLRLATKFGKEKNLGFLYNNMGVFEEEMGRLDAAEEYFAKGATVSKKNGKLASEGLCYESLAILYGTRKNFTQAEHYLLKALEIYEKQGEQLLLATLMLNLGEVARKLKKPTEATNWLEASLNHAKDIGNHGVAMIAESAIATIFSEQKQHAKAISHLKKAEKLVDSVQVLRNKIDFYNAATEVHRAAGNWEQSFKYNGLYHTLRDSVFSQERVKQVEDFRTRYEVAEKDKALLKQQNTIERNKLWQALLIAGLLIATVLGLVALRAFRYKSRINKIIKAEKRRSDALLLNILPISVAEELKSSNKVSAKRFENVSVLCTDFQGFTGISEQLEPEALILLLDEYFKGFDEITTRLGIEKIKTMGDAYMCAGGLPDSPNGNIKQTMEAALEIAAFVKKLKIQKQREGLPFFECRIGLHIGPVVAGVVGQKKFVYDIWGDTVNLATRMEQHGVVGAVNISEFAKTALGELPNIQVGPRGEIDVKGKGRIKMYTVENLY